MTHDSSFHYPADLMNLLVQTIPLLNRGKGDVFLFFQGAGVKEHLMSAIHTKWKQSYDSVNKYDIVRHILTSLNEDKGDRYLRERREILKRVVEFDSFFSCWPADLHKAKGLVAEIKDITKLKDSATKIVKEVEKNRQERINQHEKQAEEALKKRNDISKVKNNLNALFAETNAHVRGKALEQVLNDLFKLYGIGIREAFTLKGVDDEGIIEQIDGVIELYNNLYLVEMKWWKIPIGVGEIAEHIVRMFLRSDTRGIIISASSFTEPAISQCRDLLSKKTISLVTLHELVNLLEREGDLVSFLKQKIDAAVLERTPWHPIL